MATKACVFIIAKHGNFISNVNNSNCNQNSSPKKPTYCSAWAERIWEGFALIP